MPKGNNMKNPNITFIIGLLGSILAHLHAGTGLGTFYMVLATSFYIMYGIELVIILIMWLLNRKLRKLNSEINELAEGFGVKLTNEAIQSAIGKSFVEKRTKEFVDEINELKTRGLTEEYDDECTDN